MSDQQEPGGIMLAEYNKAIEERNKLLALARDWLEFMVKHPGDGEPKNLIARIEVVLAAATNTASICRCPVVTGGHVIHAPPCLQAPRDRKET